jgi:molybdate transport system substrate-binding protein
VIPTPSVPSVRSRFAPLAIAVLTLVTLTGLVAGCSSSSDAAAGTSTGTVTLTVAAASSLTEVLPKIGEAFTQREPGTKVQFSFASSSDVAAQVDAGSPIDVIALAGSSSLDAIATKVGTPELFTSNRLVIIVPPGNPKDVQSLADLADVRVSLGAGGVPAGDYAREALAAAGVKVTPASLEVDVKGVVSRVAVGGADAGIVYVTDAQAAAGDVDAVPIPTKLNVVAQYPATTVVASTHPDQATAFMQFLLSDTAQQLLREAGFGPVPSE